MERDNDISFFKHHRKVEHRDGSESREFAPLKKFIYSLIDLREILLGCNHRYLEFLSSLNDYSDGRRALQQLTEPKTDHGTQVRGLNFFETLMNTTCYSPFNALNTTFTACVDPI